VSHLTAYKSQRCPGVTATSVERVKDVEQKTGQTGLAEGRRAPKNYSKLLSYKDEYEVAAALCRDGVRPPASTSSSRATTS